MFFDLLYIAVLTTIFVGFDRYITERIQFQGAYYAVHAFHNACIVHFTAADVWHTLTDFATVGSVGPNMDALRFCFALHLYHCIMYWQKFRFDDWLHHGLMIGIALPLGWALPSGRLLGFSLFFTTGLPGGIDYVLLFLNRNGLVSRSIEKRVNTWLNVWIRAPGTAAEAALSLVYLSSTMDTATTFQLVAGLTTAALNYWNGQYFMQQVVWDYAQRSLFEGVTGSAEPVLVQSGG